MRLLEAEVSGYKRLASPGPMALDERLICILGPNGVGKTSFLDALVLLTSGRTIESKEQTRVRGTSDRLATKIRAKFALDDDDRSVLGEIPEAVKASPKIYEIFRHSGESGIRSRIEPRPVRDLGHRQSTADSLEKLRKSHWLKAVVDWDNEAGTNPAQRTEHLLVKALDVCAVVEEDLSSTETNALEGLRDRLQEVLNGSELAKLDQAFPSYGEQVHQAVSSLIEYEESDPDREARALLRKKRLPQFLKFEADDRDIKAEYELTDGEAPNAAVRNLLALGGKTWDEAVNAGVDENKTTADNFQEELNSRLKETFRRSWDQSDMFVKFRIDGTTLSVLVSLNGPGDAFYIDEHSEGVQQFVALRAFIAAHTGSVKPIILVDEVETHLHYDAQANLISRFEEQEEAEAIIYTTHSAGALPRDIAVGLRSIRPVFEDTPDGPRPTRESTASSEFWFDDAGVAPVLMAMGASAFAFSTARRAVVVEGLTDALLLPTLIREVAKSPGLGYQLVPQLSRIDEAQANELERIAASVAFVTDGDEGGANHRNDLVEKGVDGDRILALGGEGSDVTLEDLVRPEIFEAVMNQLLDEAGCDIELDMAVIGNARRMKDVENWCDAQSTSKRKVTCPTKPEIAKLIYRRRSEFDSLVDPDHEKTLTGLHSQIEAILG